MKPSEDKLERLLKKAIKGESVNPEELFFHWRNLGVRGDLKVIQVVNRQESWASFISWIARVPNGQIQLQSLSEKAGVPVQANSSLREAGVTLNETDSPRLRAQWIARAVDQNLRGEWVRARTMMVSDPAFFEGALSLLQKSSSAAEFLNGLLQETITPDQDRAIRKTLYNLRKQGVDQPQSDRAIESEIFAFAENRIPLWQPLFYFRAHSAYADIGDIFLIYINEGRSFEITDQKSNVRLTREAWGKLLSGFTENLTKQVGLTVPFREVSPADARYLLNKTYSFIQKSADSRRMSDFIRFISNTESGDPFTSFTSVVSSDIPGGSLLENSYFSAWLLDSEPAERFLEITKEAAQGPIILPETQMKERQIKAEREAIEEYFSGDRRAVWSFVWQKAAYFLHPQDPPVAQSAWAVGNALADPDVPVVSIDPCLALFERTTEYVKQQKKAEEEQEKKSSLIMSPQDFEKQHRRKK